MPSESHQPTQNDTIVWGFQTLVLRSMLVYWCCQ